MIEAVPKVAALDRAACRRHVERLFSPSVMADGYEAVYQRILTDEPGGNGAQEHADAVDTAKRVA